MQQRPSNVGGLTFLLLTVIILGSAWLYTNWKSSQTVLPPGLTISELPMGGMTREQALDAIALAYTAPITVYYESEVSLLLPEMVDLTLDTPATAENLDRALAARTDATGFFRYVQDRILMRDPETLTVSAVVDYSRPRLDAFLERMAQKYNRTPQTAVPLPEAGTFRPPRAGTTLILAESRPRLIAAILTAAPQRREVHLVVEVEPAPETSVEVLRDALTATLQAAGAEAGIFVKDLRGGQEFCLRCNAAHSEVGLLKIGVALELYRLADTGLSAQATALISGTLLRADHTVADQLLAQIGAGDSYSGALQVTELLWSMGLKNSFVGAPYTLRDQVAPPGITTPANAEARGTVPLDPYAQTTPVEMGLLLEGLYQCAEGGGMLRVIHPHAITPDECASLLAWMQRGDSWLTRDLSPPLTAAAHRGWKTPIYAEGALLYGAQTDIAVVVFLYHPTWMTPDASGDTFARAGQLIYSFYNGTP